MSEDAPTISQKQRNKALSAKKGKKETIKSVLVKPFTDFWPQVSPEDNTVLIRTLEANLPRVKHDKPSIPYKSIKEIPKSERKSFRLKFSDQVPLSSNVGLIFGVNDVSRLLEQQEAASILVESTVQPKLLVQHVVDQAVLHNVPILVVTDLKKTLAVKSGIPSTTVALKNGSSLELIQKCVHDIAKKYPVPENHINYHRRQDLNDNDKEAPLTEENVIEDKSDDDCMRIVHLRRRSKKERVFVPELSKNFGQIVEHIDLDLRGFIPFSNRVDEPETRGKSNNYKSLVVKRLRGDKNRLQNKVQKRGKNKGRNKK